MELSTGKILEENLLQSAFHQTLGHEFTFQQDNNLKHKAKYTLVLLTKKTVNVSECFKHLPSIPKVASSNPGRVTVLT